MATDNGPDQSPLLDSTAFSSRVEPFWLNPATIKGTVALGAGFFLLIFPQASVVLIRFVLGTALIISGASDIWFQGRDRKRLSQRSSGVRGLIEGLVTIGFGIALLLSPTETMKVVAILAGIYFAVRGIGVLLAAVTRQRKRGDPWLIDAARGLFFIAFAAVVLLIPEGVIASLLIGGAVLAVVLGAIMLVYGINHHSDEELVDLDKATVTELVMQWVTDQDVGPEHRDDIADGLYFEEPARAKKLAAWWVMLLLSVAIATFAILQDSTAVVIGAMLIAPLMTPIIGIAGAIVNGWRWRLIASLALIAAGVSASIALAYIIGAWMPAIVPLDVNTQVTSRVSPNMLDMAIALAAGAAGAYAIVDKRVSDSIAGVAIAVALVPPLGVVGLTLEAGMLSESGGAFLLFLTNLVSIVIAAVLVFFLTGFVPLEQLRSNRSEFVVIMRTVVVAALVILIPLTFTAEGVLATAGRQVAAQDDASEWLGDDTDLRLVRVEVDGATVKVVLSGAGEIPSVEALEDILTNDFKTPTTVQVEYVPTLFITYSDEDGKTEVGAGDDSNGG